MISTYLSNLSPAIEFSSNGLAGDYQGDKMGRFELLIGEERDGCPVYKQVYSREIPKNVHILLYRWENVTYIS